MKIVAALSLLAGASAFAPAAKQASSSTALNMFENEIGVIAPTGYFDPFKLATSQDKFDRYRAVELKHGRVAQLAVLGYVFQEVYRFPGDLAFGLPFSDIPNGLDAVAAVPAAGWAQILFLVGAVDFNGYLGDFEVGKPDLDGPVLAKRQLQEIQ
jgi:hypothetical protein